MYEPHLLQSQAYSNLLERLEKLSPQSQALWGKMNVAQMLAHVTANLGMAMSDKKVTQVFMGRIFGKAAVRDILTKGVQPKNMSTFSHLKISDPREFKKEKERLRLQLSSSRVEKGASQSNRTLSLVTSQPTNGRGYNTFT
jgi:hypothetical protein